MPRPRRNCSGVRQPFFLFFTRIMFLSLPGWQAFVSPPARTASPALAVSRPGPTSQAAVLPNSRQENEDASRRPTPFTDLLFGRTARSRSGDGQAQTRCSPARPPAGNRKKLLLKAAMLDSAG